jgi:hypothetical protein
MRPRIGDVFSDLLCLRLIYDDLATGKSYKGELVNSFRNLPFIKRSMARYLHETKSKSRTMAHLHQFQFQ